RKIRSVFQTGLRRRRLDRRYRRLRSVRLVQQAVQQMMLFLKTIWIGKSIQTVIHHVRSRYRIIGEIRVSAFPTVLFAGSIRRRRRTDRRVIRTLGELAISVRPRLPSAIVSGCVSPAMFAARSRRRRRSIRRGTEALGEPLLTVRPLRVWSRISWNCGCRVLMLPAMLVPRWDRRRWRHEDRRIKIAGNLFDHDRTRSGWFGRLLRS